MGFSATLAGIVRCFISCLRFQVQTVVFTVAEYSLPKFEVKITPPPFVLSWQESITWKICANYTFGKPVTGKLKVNISLVDFWGNTRRRYWQATPAPDKYFETDVSCLTWIRVRLCLLRSLVSCAL